MIKIQPGDTNKRALFSIHNSVPRVRKGLRVGLTEIGRENSRHLQIMIRTGPRTGRIYGNHQASAPGEPPANWTGRLAGSVGSRVFGWSRMEFGETVFYGRFLEFGTSKMEPRPHVVRTVTEKRRDNFNTLAQSVDIEIKR
jgi:hypothetical protein